MNTKWHKEVIEALGMMAPKARIVNKLNSAAAKPDDPKLRAMAYQLIEEIMSVTANTSVSPPKDMKNGVPTGTKALSYCESVAYS